MRVGIYTSPVVAAVIGKCKFSYDVWGDTLNVVVRLEQAGTANQIPLLARLKVHLGNGYNCISRVDVTFAGHEAAQVFGLVGRA